MTLDDLEWCRSKGDGQYHAVSLNLSYTYRLGAKGFGSFEVKVARKIAP